MNGWKNISLCQNTSVTEQQFCGLDSNILDWSPGHLSLQVPLDILLIPSVLCEGQGHQNAWTSTVLAHCCVNIYIPLYDWTN